MIGYFLESAILMLLFCGCYHFVFKRFTFFTLNRFYLIISLLICLFTPLLKFKVNSSAISNMLIAMPEDVMLDNTEEIINQQGSVKTITQEQSPLNWVKQDGYSIGVALVIYTLVAGILLIKLLIVITFLYLKSLKGYRNEGFIILPAFKRFSNCSFFNLLFISGEGLSKEEFGQIVAHEKVHREKLHSADKIVAEFAQALMWFNPLIYYYKNAINQNHEYEVDSLLVRVVNKEDYSNFLVKLCSPSTPYFTNGFSSHPLKERIQFIFKKPSHNMKKLIYLTLLPLVLPVVTVFALEKAKVVSAIIESKELPSGSSAFRFKPDNQVFAKEKTGVGEKTTLGIITDLAESLQVNDIVQLPTEVSLTNLISKPVSAALNANDKFTVILDPGHGGKDNAAHFDGIYEKDLVLEISKSIKGALEKNGFNVISTRNSDEFIALSERVKNKGDVFISIHVNSTPANYKGTKPGGMDIYVPNKYRMKDSTLLNRSMSLGSSFKAELSSLDIKMSTDLKDVNLYVLGNNPSPSILLELGYLDNKTDLLHLTNKAYQDKLAESFVKAINGYKSRL